MDVGLEGTETVLVNYSGHDLDRTFVVQAVPIVTQDGIATFIFKFACVVTCIGSQGPFKYKSWRFLNGSSG